MLLTDIAQPVMWFTCAVIWFSPLLPSTQLCWPTALHIVIVGVLRLAQVVGGVERGRVATIVVLPA